MPSLTGGQSELVDCLRRNLNVGRLDNAGSDTCSLTARVAASGSSVTTIQYVVARAPPTMMAVVTRTKIPLSMAVLWHCQGRRETHPQGAGRGIQFQTDPLPIVRLWVECGSLTAVARGPLTAIEPS